MIILPGFRLIVSYIAARCKKGARFAERERNHVFGEALKCVREALTNRSVSPDGMIWQVFRRPLLYTAVLLRFS